MNDVLDVVPCGYLCFDADGRILCANAKMAAMVEDTPKSLSGSSIENLLTVGARIFYQTHFYPLLKLKGVVEEIFLTLRTRSGGEIPVLVNAARRELTGTDVYDCSVFLVHQRGKFEDQLLKAKKSAEEAARVRDDFLAVVSHELRSPLNAILGWAQILRLGADADMVEEGARVIERNAQMQARLIEDLIDVSRTVSGKLRLAVETVSLQSVIEQALDVVGLAAESKAIKIHTELDPAVGPISGDPSRLQQVIWNLLSNAVKFTPEGGSVRLQLKRIKSHLELQVSDTGEGIVPELLPYVFQRFRQAEGASAARHHGLGLGMAITKEIVELHGGTIRAESAGKGTGATFFVSLPLLIAPVPSEPAYSA